MSLRETIERIRSSPKPLNEEAAKNLILLPILSDLSWNMYKQEVLWEHPVGGKKRGGKVDIALRAEGRIWALIEAKAPGTNLNNYVDQVLFYAFHESVDICALSDGLQWWLYLPQEKGKPAENRFTVLSLDKDPVDQTCSDLTTFLGRDSLLSGQAVERAQQVLIALREAEELEKEMPAIWKEMLDKPDDELVELIGQRVFDGLSLRPGRAQILAVLRNMPIPPKPPVPPEPLRPDPPPKDQPTAVKSPTNRPVAVRLWGERYEVKTHVEILMTVITELQRRHSEDFDHTVAQLKSGSTQYVATDPRLVRGTRTRQIASGHYLDVNLSAPVIKGRAIECLTAFGYSESDLEYIYE